MCGITGVARFSPGPPDPYLPAMMAALHHRGPDDSGMFELPDQGVSMGMARLSILDIEGGHQPMFDERERYALVFNGEIYNFAPLRRELMAVGHRFASHHSDSEVIVHGFEEWGNDVFRRLNGMFAIAVWDREMQALTLARDRAGEKPLYVAEMVDGGWAFASEMKALLARPNLDRTINALALEEYLAFDFVLGPRTMLRDVWKVPAGASVTLTRAGHSTNQFWTPRHDPIERTEPELNDELDRLLARSVEMRMVADVPLGLFLSGGLDSTTIGWYMARASDHVRAFSIGFEDPAFDETEEVRLAANHLGISVTIHEFSAGQVLDLVPRITDLLDEPMGDQSIFPTHLLSSVARRDVKVALGGDGSDELFMGYRTYQALKLAWSIGAIPGLGRAGRVAAHLIPTAPGIIGRVARFGRTLHLDPEQRLLSRLGSFQGASQWILSRGVREQIGAPALARGTAALRPDDEVGPAERTVHAYLRGYLQEDILVKVDRASMATSLEVRSPFLDADLIDFALSIPSSTRLKGFTRKHPLRQLMRGRIPDRIIDRPKQGFAAPLNAWMRGPLSQMLRDYLSPDRITRAGIFDPDAVAGLLSRHFGGDDNAGQQSWLLLQFELWRERWLNSSADIGTT